MMLRRIFSPAALALMAGGFVVAQQQPAAGPQSRPAEPGVVIIKAPEPPKDQPQFKPELRAVDLAKRPKLSEGTKMQLIQLMDAELVHVRKYFPLGDKSIVITPEGVVKPGDAQLFLMTQGSGAAAKVGDKVQITNVKFHDKSITFEINGGPKKKSKWYQHITISGAGGDIAPVDPNQAQPTGAAMTLQFSKYVPEMNGEELKKLVGPVLDFSVKTAAEVYVDTLPPKIREAVKAHEVLVGMNKDMVVMAKDRPAQRVREKDESGKEYEEWIYGTPPQDVVFVRFKGDEVTQVKIAKVGGQMIVKTEKEVDVKDGVVTLAALKASNSPEDAQKQSGPQGEQRAKRPTLKRPDEMPDPDMQPHRSTVDNPPRDEDPQWGDKKNSGNTSDQTGAEEPQWGDKKSSGNDQTTQQKPPQL
jgi:hypothetical protein